MKSVSWCLLWSLCGRWWTEIGFPVNEEKKKAWGIWGKLKSISWWRGVKQRNCDYYDLILFQTPSIEWITVVDSMPSQVRRLLLIYEERLFFTKLRDDIRRIILAIIFLEKFLTWSKFPLRYLLYSVTTEPLRRIILKISS